MEANYGKDRTLAKEVDLFFLFVNSANGRVYPGQRWGGGWETGWCPLKWR